MPMEILAPLQKNKKYTIGTYNETLFRIKELQDKGMNNSLSENELQELNVLYFYMFGSGLTETYKVLYS